MKVDAISFVVPESGRAALRLCCGPRQSGLSMSSSCHRRPFEAPKYAGGRTAAEELGAHLVAEVKEADRETAKDNGEVHPVRPEAALESAGLADKRNLDVIERRYNSQLIERERTSSDRLRANRCEGEWHRELVVQLASPPVSSRHRPGIRTRTAGRPGQEGLTPLIGEEDLADGNQERKRVSLV